MVLAVRDIARGGQGLLARFFESVGELTILFFKTLGAVAGWRIPVAETVRQMNYIGVASIPIAMITVAFSAAVLALHTALEFIQYGRGDVIGSVIAITVAREVAPVLTAVLVAARVGASIAAELGTMAVTEQVDALRALAVSPVQYLVVPRFLAATLMLSVVTLFSAAGGVIGGALVVTSMAHLAPAQYWNSARAMPVSDLLLGLSKTFVFGMIISLVGCWQGLRTTGGAAGVGRSTTAAVVISTVLVYIANYYLAALLFGERKIAFF
jgi:phospholipid/cholesterol/gamma-HCH transport system permease protein